MYKKPQKVAQVSLYSVHIHTLSS